MHDLHVLLSDLLAIMIDEEGDKYVNSSAVVPRLLGAVAKINKLFDKASNLNDSTFLNANEVLRWRPTFNVLAARYIEPFYLDEAYLVATVCDRRFGVETLPRDLLPAANAALTARLTAVHDRLEAERAAALQHRLGLLRNESSSRQVDTNLNSGVAEARELQVADYKHDKDDLARVFGDNAVAVVPLPESATFRTVAEEKQVILSLPRLEMKDDPMQYYTPSSPYKLELTRHVVLDVFAMPSSEAPCERVFSIASRVLGQSRNSISPIQLERLTFLKKNVAMFKEKK